MSTVTILVKRPGPFEQIFNLPLPGYCIWNLIEIGPAVSEEKSFEKVEDAHDTDNGQQITVYTISSPRAFGSSELKIRCKLLTFHASVKHRKLNINSCHNNFLH